MKKFNVYVSGVGGQGAVMLGQFLKTASLKKDNIKVIGSETRGAAQREGSVNATIRYAVIESGEELDERKSVHSVSIPMGEADLVLSLEACEILKSIKYISEKTTIILSTYRIFPRPVITQGLDYPEVDDVVEFLKNITSDIQLIDANKLSKDYFGDFTMVSMIFLGAALATGKLPVTVDDVKAVIEEVHRMPDRAFKAFDLGFNAIKQ